MKRLLYLLIILLVPFNVFAASGTVKASASSTNVTLNNTVTVTVKVSSTGKLGSWKYGLSYDKSKLSLISGDQSIVGYGDGTFSSKSYTYKFKAIAVGNATISIDDAKIGDWDSESYISTTTSNLTLKIKEPVVINYSSDNNLKELKVDGFELSPSFDKKTLEYNVTTLPTTTKINIIATANDSKAKVSGAGEVEVKEGLNEFNIEVTAENGTKKTYTIKVTVPEKNPIVYNFKEGEFNILRKLPEELPNGFSKSIVNFNDEAVDALQSEILNLTLIYLKKDNDSNFYIYNEKNNSVSLYNELGSSDFKIYLLNKEVLVKGLIKESIKINNVEVSAYKLTKNSNNYVVSGRNISTGKEDLYVYDTLNKTISVFNQKDYEELTSTNDIFKYITLGLSLITVILLILTFVTNHNRKKLVKIIKEKIEKQKINDDKNEKGKKDKEEEIK